MVVETAAVAVAVASAVAVAVAVAIAVAVVLLKLDFENAFNSVSRQQVLHTIVAEFSQLSG